MSHSELCLKNAPIEEIAKIASDIIYQEKVEKKILSIKDVSGNSGAKTFICSEGEIPKCIVKVKGNESIMSSHPNCLLYTSPSPRDATLSRMPSSA